MTQNHRIYPLTWTVLELYAIEIQMYSDLKENRKLKVGCIGLDGGDDMSTDIGRVSGDI
jgi:hypothetical protein